MKVPIIAALLLAGLFQSAGLLAATATRRPVRSTASKKKPAAASKKSVNASKKSVSTSKRPAVASARRRKKPTPKYKPAPPVDPTIGDNVDGDNLEVRRAAVEALGTMNGSVVVVEPNTGRILTIVNQKLALSSGYTPCSTIKLVTSLAALNENIVARDTYVPIGRRTGFNLTNAVAHSNNQYFSILGNRLGFERVTRYAHMLGVGELAGLNVPGEQPGVVAEEPPKWGGVGMMTSFGEGFQLTPLELAGIVSAIANGGTLYYLQYPRTADEIESFTPKIKRELALSAATLEDLKTGMRGAVDFGTARRANYDPSEPIYGKTGTCTDFRLSTHMGWFGSFNEIGGRQLVVVVMLTGTKSINGPVASGVAGAVYRKLSERRYFAAETDGVHKTGLPEILTSYPTNAR